MKNLHLPLASMLVLCFLSFTAGASMAQTGTIKGKIIDQQTKEVLAGATIVVEQTAFGAAADADGNYVIDNVPAGTYRLTARYIGYQSVTHNVHVEEGQTLTENFELLTVGYTTSPMVVTAIGTQASREQMGTAVSTVPGQTLTMTGANDISTALEVQAPGLNTTESNGDPGAATRMVLRGVRSLETDNQPLIVLDGEPVWNNTIYNQLAVNNNYTNGGVSAYSPLDEINPQDVQSIEVYSGPSAAALWGSRGANGVIVITTKSGSFTPGKKVNISVHESTESDALLGQEPLQTDFGQGTNGKYTWNSKFSWGDMISQRSGEPNTVNSDGTITSGTAADPSGGKTSKTVYDQATDIFQNPVSPDYGVTLSGGDASGTFYLDVDRLGQTGIIKANSDFDRTSINAAASHIFSEDLTMRVNASYVSTTTDRINQGSNLAGLMLDSYRTPPDFNEMPYLVNFVAPDGSVTPNSQRGFRDGNGDPNVDGIYDNPFYTIYENPTNLADTRVLGSAELAYDPLSWLDFTYRAGVDYLGDRNTSIYGYYDWTVPNGEYLDNLFSQYQINSDLQGTAHHDFSSNFSGSLLAGFHLDHQQYDYMAQIVQTFLIPAPPYYLSNAATPLPPNQYDWIVRDAALYGEIDLSLYNQLFVTLAGRDESSSTYGPGSAGLYFYPSASVAWQFTKLPALQGNDILNFGKLRAAFGEAAVQPPVYSSLTYFAANQTIENGWGSGVNPQYWGGGATIQTYLGNNLLGNSSIAPERTDELEGGLDLTLFNSRATISATQYSDKTIGDIIPTSVPPSTGFGYEYSNAVDLTNVGTELQLNVQWLQVGQFSWLTLFNWSTNKNEVTSMPSGTQYFFLNGFTDPFSAAVLHEPVGVIFGTHWLRTGDSANTANGLPITSGKLILDGNGFPQVGASDAVIGNPNPKWRGGFGNTFKFQRATLNVLFDIKVGGQVYNGTEAALDYFGRYGDQNWWTKITADQATNLKNWAGQTVAEMVASGDYGNSYVKNADGSYNFRGYVTNYGAGDVIVDQAWFTEGPGSALTGGASEQWVEDGSYVRLREVSLSYLFPLNTLGLESLQISVIGRNLALWSKYKGQDPETNLTGPSTGQGLEWFDDPSVKTWILSLQVNY